MIQNPLYLFDEKLEYINTNQIEQIIDKIGKSLHLDGLTEEDEIKYEKDMNSSNASFNFNKKKKLKFPNYDGTFKNDIDKFIRNNPNKDLNNLYELIIKEIQKVYHSYLNIESKLYKKINYYIQFSDSKDNKPMEIISKLKEISETLSDTIKFIELYLYQNFHILKTIFINVDQKLSYIFDAESISLYFLLDIFDLPNNELSYMLMFKIIDEESCILKYIVEKLNAQIKDNKENSEKNENTPDKESNLLNQSMASPAYNAILNIKNKYINKINELIINIDAFSYFRAKYYNKFIYLKGNYEVDTNLFLNFINEDNDDNNEEFLPINSLMDEEVIINKFINKSIINRFLIFFKSQLPNSFKKNEKIILFHTIQYNIISVFAIYSYKSFDYIFLNNAFFYLGKIFSKILFNIFIKKRNKIKNLLLTSNMILVVSLFIYMFFTEKSYYKYIYYFSRFLIGFSYSKNIETKFIINYIPKLLIKQEIKKYYCTILLSSSIGFILVSGFNYIFSLEEFNKEEKSNKFDNNNIMEIILGSIAIIILIINFIFFKEPNYYDIIKTRSRRSSSKNVIPEGVNIEDKKDAASIFSYGKAKLISFKEKNKAKILEESLKLDIGQKNYEGTNQIFTILQKLIINENESSDSHINKTVKGYILLYIILYTISSLILFYIPIINTSKKYENINIYETKNKIWVFGISYLFTFLIYKFKLLNISRDIFMLKIIILIFICFEIALTFVFIFSDDILFNSTPIYFDNYFFYVILSIILFFNIIIENICLKVMIREIPIEKKISSINIDNFLDIFESIIKAGIFVGLYFITYYKIVKEIIYIKIVIGILYILGCIIFFFFNFKKRQIALIKIINKITYESF